MHIHTSASMISMPQNSRPVSSLPPSPHTPHHISQKTVPFPHLKKTHSRPTYQNSLYLVISNKITFLPDNLPSFDKGGVGGGFYTDFTQFLHIMARLTAAQAPQINEIVEKVTKRDLAYLQTSTDVLETLTGSLNNRFIVDPTFTSILTKINNGLNIQDRLDEIDEILNDPTIDPATALPIGLNDRLRELRAQIALRNGDINAQQ